MIIALMNTVTTLNSRYKLWGIIPPLNKEGYKMSDTEKIIINTFNDFKQQLMALKEDTTATLMSYFKYCWLHDNENDFNFYRELIEDELEAFGLKAYLFRVTDDMNLIFRYNKKAEVVVYIKAYGIDVFIHRK